MSTNSVSRESAVEWWSAELEELASITKILVYANSWALANGKYKRFKVEVKTSQNEAWKVCKAEHAMQAPHNPNVVICDGGPTDAKYVRLSVAGGVNLYLTEVKVRGSNLGKFYWGVFFHNHEAIRVVIKGVWSTAHFLSPSRRCFRLHLKNLNTRN